MGRAGAAGFRVRVDSESPGFESELRQLELDASASDLCLGLGGPGDAGRLRVGSAPTRRRSRLGRPGDSSRRLVTQSRRPPARRPRRSPGGLGLDRPTRDCPRGHSSMARSVSATRTVAPGRPGWSPGPLARVRGISDPGRNQLEFVPPSGRRRGCESPPATVTVTVTR